MSIFAFASSNYRAREGSALDDETATTATRAQSASFQLSPTAAATFARRQSAFAKSRRASQSQIARLLLEDCARDCADQRDLCRRTYRGQTLLHRQPGLQIEQHRSAKRRHFAA